MTGLEALIRNRAYELWEQEGHPKGWHELHWAQAVEEAARVRSSSRHLPLGADKGYNSADVVADLRQACVIPHVARKGRHSAIDGRILRHTDYPQSQKRRNTIEESFGWAKTVGGMVQTV